MMCLLHTPMGDIFYSDNHTSWTAWLDQYGIRNMTYLDTTETNYSPTNCGCNNCTPRVLVKNRVTSLHFLLSKSGMVIWKVVGKERGKIALNIIFFLIFKRFNFALSILYLVKHSNDFEVNENSEIYSSLLNFWKKITYSSIMEKRF